MIMRLPVEAAFLFYGESMKRFFDKALLLYCITGFLNYVLCNSIMFVLYNLGLANMGVSSLVNYTLGGFVWYYACYKFVFPGRKHNATLVSRFIAEIMVCYLVSYYFVAPLLLHFALYSGIISGTMLSHHGLSSQAAGNYTMAIGSVTYSILNYFGQRFFVFSTPHSHRRHRHSLSR